MMDLVEQFGYTIDFYLVDTRDPARYGARFFRNGGKLMWYLHSDGMNNIYE